MTDEETKLAAQTILNWVNSQRAMAVSELSHRKAVEVGREASDESWWKDEENQSPGPIGSPFNDHGRGKMEIIRLETKAKDWSVVQQFAVDRLCSMIKSED